MAKAKKKAAAPVRGARSASAALGGKMSKRTVRLAITNIHMDGDYTGTIHLGSRRKACNVIFDTGSSTLAIDGSHYDVTGDRQAKITSVAQEVGYADGSNWVGGVALTEVMVGERKLKLPGVPVAIAYHTSNKMFGSANGILGLAYSKLNPAFTMPGPTLPPHYTYNQIQNGLVSHLEPYFAKLEDAGLVANKFAFYTRRSMVRKARGGFAAGGRRGHAASERLGRIPLRGIRRSHAQSRRDPAEAGSRPATGLGGGAVSHTLPTHFSTGTTKDHCI